MLTNGLKASLRTTLPGLYAFLQESWTSFRIRSITRLIVEGHGLVVQSGPFAGMRYVPRATGSMLLPKLLGSYEAELHSVMDEIISSNYNVIIDVGCAEGYYAVGLALRLPQTHVFAFDLDPQARRLCGEMACANDVADRIHVAGECDIERLGTLAQRGALVICDCEGCELTLLRPDLVRNLAYSDLLVELHDFIDRNISPTILSRFTPTHDISLVPSIERDPSNYPALRTFCEWDQRIAVAEFREEKMQWAFMRTRAVPPE